MSEKRTFLRGGLRELLRELRDLLVELCALGLCVPLRAFGLNGRTQLT